MGRDGVKSYLSLPIRLQGSGAGRHTLRPSYQDETRAGNLQATLCYFAPEFLTV